MHESSVEEQLESLRDMGQSWVALAAQGIFVVPALILFYKAFTMREYGLITIGVVVLFFALIIQQGMPHIRRAIEGIDSADRSEGSAQISIEESTETTYYYADVTIPGRGRWVLEFRPQGWTPTEALLPVACHFIPGVDWPVLLLADKGVMSPSTTPKKIDWNV